jgi:hypothetical protein
MLHLGKRPLVTPPSWLETCTEDTRSYGCLCYVTGNLILSAVTVSYSTEGLLYWRELRFCSLPIGLRWCCSYALGLHFMTCPVPTPTAHYLDLFYYVYRYRRCRRIRLTIDCLDNVLDVSQPYRPPWPVNRDSFTFLFTRNGPLVQCSEMFLIYSPLHWILQESFSWNRSSLINSIDNLFTSKYVLPLMWMVLDCAIGSCRAGLMYCCPGHCAYSNRHPNVSAKFYRNISLHFAEIPIMKFISYKFL